MMENSEVSQSIDLQPFFISDIQWQGLRQVLSTTTDPQLIEDVYELLGEMEMQLAYCCHVLDQRAKDLQ